MTSEAHSWVIIIIISVLPRQRRLHKSLNIIMDAKQHELTINLENGMTTPSIMNDFAVILISMAPPGQKPYRPN